MLRGRIFAVATLLSACGDVTPDKSPLDQSAATPAVVEETAYGSGEAYTPKVVLAVPASAAYVRPNVVVKLLFSMPMDTEVSSAAFSVLNADGDPLDGTVAWDVTAMVLAFRPDEPLTEGAYRAHVDQVACDADGVELALPFSTDFQVYQPNGNDKPYAG